MKQQDEAQKKGRKFAHCVVAGIERYPKKVTKRMGPNKIAKRSKVKPFVKFVNYAHLMPTRYVLGPELDLKTLLKEEDMAKKETREGAKKNIKKLFEEKYAAPAAAKDEKALAAEYFFRKLKF